MPTERRNAESGPEAAEKARLERLKKGLDKTDRDMKPHPLGTRLFDKWEKRPGKDEPVTADKLLEFLSASRFHIFEQFKKSSSLLASMQVSKVSFQRRTRHLR